MDLRKPNYWIAKLKLFWISILFIYFITNVVSLKISPTEYCFSSFSNIRLSMPHKTTRKSYVGFSFKKKAFKSLIYSSKLWNNHTETRRVLWPYYSYKLYNKELQELEIQNLFSNFNISTQNA